MPPKYPIQPGKPQIEYEGTVYENLYKTKIPKELSREEVYAQLKSFYYLEDEPHLNVLEEVIRETEPDFRITRADRSDTVRAQRRQTMNAAQGTILNYLLDKSATNVPPMLRGLGRPYGAFISYGGTEEAAAKNRRLLELVVENDSKKLSDYFYNETLAAVRTIQECNFTAESAFTMSDEELVNVMPQILPAYERIMELQSIISAGKGGIQSDKIPVPGQPGEFFEQAYPFFVMNDERINELSSFIPMMDQLSIAKSRLDLIASPYYEHLDMSKLRRLNADDLLENFKKRCQEKGLNYDEEYRGPLDQLGTKFSCKKMFSIGYLRSMLGDKMRNDGIDPARAYHYTRLGKEETSESLGASAETLLLGDPLVVTAPDKSLHFYTFDGKQMRSASLSQTVDALAESFDGAKLFMRGSAEFSTMHKEMKALQQMAKTMGNPPSVSDAAKLANTARALKESAREYLWYKGFALQQDVTVDLDKDIADDWESGWDKFNYQNANTNAAKRIKAARGAIALAASLNHALEKLYDPTRMRDDAEVQNGQEAVNNEVKPQEVAAQPEPDGVTGQQLEEAVAGFAVATLPPETLQDRENIAHGLHTDVSLNLQSVFASAAERAKKSGKSTVELTEAEKAVFKETLAKALVLNQINKGQFAPFNDPNKTPADIRKAIDDNVRSVVDRKGPTHSDPLSTKRALSILNGGPDNLLSALATRLTTGKAPKEPSRDDFAITYGHKPPQKEEPKKQDLNRSFLP